ncbi:MAG: TRAP-type mannitol/chloroaromatic compound transport system substrate-binding protein [Saprospiraceae bacterium]
MEAASLKLNHWMLSEFEAKNTLFLERILAESKIEIRTFSDEILNTLRGYTDEILEEMTENDPFAKKVYASYDSFRNKARAWSELTEKVFYNSLQDS